MDNLSFSLNATIPVFLTMLLGVLFRKTGLFDEAFAQRLNRFVFRAALPALLFQDISGADFYQVWDTPFVVFCFAATCLSICLAAALSCLLKDHRNRGEFIQSAYRSSAAILGIAFIQNIYGNAGMAPLMIISSVPLYNIMAVVVLSLSVPTPDPNGQTDACVSRKPGIDRHLFKKPAGKSSPIQLSWESWRGFSGPSLSFLCPASL